MSAVGHIEGKSSNHCHFVTNGVMDKVLRFYILMLLTVFTMECRDKHVLLRAFATDCLWHLHFLNFVFSTITNGSFMLARYLEAILSFWNLVYFCQFVFYVGIYHGFDRLNEWTSIAFVDFVIYFP